MHACMHATCLIIFSENRNCFLERKVEGMLSRSNLCQYCACMCLVLIEGLIVYMHESHPKDISFLTVALDEGNSHALQLRGLH